MATLPTYFRDFLAEIRPTENQRKEMQTGHRTLRERLADWEDLRPIVVSDFLQGSYRRSTVIRPGEGQRSDVDIVVVTNLDREQYDPQEAMELFRPFVRKHYGGKYRFQGRSIRIELSYVEMDLVITAAPSEVDQKALCWAAVQALDTPEDVDDWRLSEYWVPLSSREELGAHSRLRKAASEAPWKLEPLWIPDRDAGCWQPTHPLAQMGWTFVKNKATNRHFVNVVKALKWWRRIRHPTPKHPKSYPLEHIIGDCCPDGLDSVAEGVACTLEEIRDRFAAHAASEVTPDLRDRGVDQNVLERVEGEDFARFHEQVTNAATLAREALEEKDSAKSAELWRVLFGDKFPRSSGGGAGGKGSGGAVTGACFSERREPSVPPRGRFA